MVSYRGDTEVYLLVSKLFVPRGECDQQQLIIASFSGTIPVNYHYNLSLIAKGQYGNDSLSC